MKTMKEAKCLKEEVEGLYGKSRAKLISGPTHNV